MAEMGQLIGAGIQAGGQIAGGMAAKKAGAFEAAQYQQKAAEERAVASRAAYEKRQERDRLISRQVAVAAAGGAGVNNASIMDIIGDTAARGQYLIDTEIAGGESRARGMMDRGAAAKAKGQNALMGSILEGGSTLAKGVYKAKFG